MVGSDKKILATHGCHQQHQWQQKALSVSAPTSSTASAGSLDLLPDALGFPQSTMSSRLVNEGTKTQFHHMIQQSYCKSIADLINYYKQETAEKVKVD